MTDQDRAQPGDEQSRSRIEIGAVLSHYRILDHLGEGGMGVLYLAEDLRLKRKVALKFLPQDSFRDSEAAQRFQREARAASALDHPHICTIYDIGEHEGEPFIAMQALEGETLEERMKGEPLGLQEILRLTAQVADALEAAHTRGILHRDIKPSNLFLTERGDVKVLDFGLAKKVEKEAEIETELTRPGTTLGTLSYMSPEQLRGAEVDARSDLFSLGVVLYELVCGVHPFRRSHAADTSAAILTQDPAPLSRYVEQVPPTLQHVVRKLLQKEPERRYQLMQELRLDLEQLREDSRQSHPVVVPDSGPRTTPRWWMGIGGAVLALIVAAVVWSGAFLDSPSPSPAGEGLEKSIAVLPLDNLSGDPENDYFSDGITDAIISRLSRNKELEVVSRTSVMRFKETQQSLGEIARELGVATLLEGSVQQAGGRVRVSARLVDARNDRPLWSETYERGVEEIFAIQSEVADEIAQALHAEFTPEESKRAHERPTENFEAYNLYLQGTHLTSRWDPSLSSQAREYFEAALELDPNFALAHVGMARTLRSDRARAFAAARRAIQLDATLAEPHIELGFLHEFLDADPVAAEVDFVRALELDPGNAEGHRQYGFLLIRNGRLEEAEERLQSARRFDPLNHLVVGGILHVHAARGEIEALLEAARRKEELNPFDPFARRAVARAFLSLGDYEKIDVWADAAERLRPRITHAVRANSIFFQGKTEELALLEPRLSIAPHRSMALIQEGKIEGARAILEELAVERPFMGLMSPQLRSTTLLGYALRGTEPERSDEMLSLSLERDRKQRIVSGGEPGHPDWLYDIATVSAIRGEKDEAYKWLQRAIDRGWLWRDLAMRDPRWTDFHGEERFQAMMEDVKTKVDAMRPRVEAILQEWGLQP